MTSRRGCSAHRNGRSPAIDGLGTCLLALEKGGDGATARSTFKVGERRATLNPRGPPYEARVRHQWREHGTRQWEKAPACRICVSIEDGITTANGPCASTASSRHRCAPTNVFDEVGSAGGSPWALTRPHLHYRRTRVCWLRRGSGCGHAREGDMRRTASGAEWIRATPPTIHAGPCAYLDARCARFERDRTTPRSREAGTWATSRGTGHNLLRALDPRAHG